MSLCENVSLYPSHDTREPKHMHAHLSSLSYVVHTSYPKWNFALGTGCAQRILRSADGLTRSTSVDTVAVSEVNGRMFVEEAETHRIAGRCFLALWTDASLIPMSQLMKSGHAIFEKDDNIGIRDDGRGMAVRRKSTSTGLLMSSEGNPFCL